MLKTIAMIGLGAALALPPVVAVAQTGYGVVPGEPSSTPFDRSWNHFNQSKRYAREGSRWARRHAEGWAYPRYRYYYPNP